MGTLVLAAMAWLYAMAIAQAQSPSATSTVSVTADNFTRAETDTYFANIVTQAGGLGKFFHRREIEPIDNQIVIRGNRDTVYSAAVFDLDAGPVTVTLPDAGGRFMSMLRREGERVNRDLASYASLNQHLMTGMKIISENLRQWKGAPESREQAIADFKLRWLTQD